MALKLDPVRLLIADDVGIGKTVEALLIARELLDQGDHPPRGLVGSLVHEIRVEGRDTIQPFFRMPRGDPKVRMPDGWVGPAGIEPAANHL